MPKRTWTCKVCGKPFGSYQGLGGHMSGCYRRQRGELPQGDFSRVVRISDKTYDMVVEYAKRNGLVFEPFWKVLDQYVTETFKLRGNEK